MMNATIGTPVTSSCVHCVPPLIWRWVLAALSLEISKLAKIAGGRFLGIFSKLRRTVPL